MERAFMYTYSIKRVQKIYKALLNRLPSTYPQAELIIHNSTQKLREYWTKDGGKKSGDPPCAFCGFCGTKEVIHIPADLNYGVDAPMEIRFVEVLLHEIGHLYAHKKYGSKDSRWSNYKISEKYADDFASRWVRKIKKEGFFTNL
jgi:Zn-dependent peptidase ImmA (M78 family)